MKNVVFAVIAIILLPVTVAVLLGLFTGVLTGGLSAAGNINFVNGYSLASLREIEPTEQYPDSRILQREGRHANSAAFGSDIPPRTGYLILATATNTEITQFYNDTLSEAGYDKIAIPTPFIAQGTESGVSVWRNDNLYFRLSFETDTRTLVEAGGTRGDVLFRVFITPLK